MAQTSKPVTSDKQYQGANSCVSSAKSDHIQPQSKNKNPRLRRSQSLLTSGPHGSDSLDVYSSYSSLTDPGRYEILRSGRAQTPGESSLSSVDFGGDLNSLRNYHSPRHRSTDNILSELSTYRAPVLRLEPHKAATPKSHAKVDSSPVRRIEIVSSSIQRVLSAPSLVKLKAGDKADLENGSKLGQRGHRSKARKRKTTIQEALLPFSVVVDIPIDPVETTSVHDNNNNNSKNSKAIDPLEKEKKIGQGHQSLSGAGRQEKASSGETDRLISSHAGSITTNDKAVPGSECKDNSLSTDINSSNNTTPGQVKTQIKIQNVRIVRKHLTAKGGLASWKTGEAGGPIVSKQGEDITEGRSNSGVEVTTSGPGHRIRVVIEGDQSELRHKHKYTCPACMVCLSQLVAASF